MSAGLSDEEILAKLERFRKADLSLPAPMPAEAHALPEAPAMLGRGGSGRLFRAKDSPVPPLQDEV